MSSLHPCYCRWLLDKGQSAHLIDKLLEQTEEGTDATSAMPAIMEQIIPHEDETTWFVNCNRTVGEEMLQGKAEGTFLIRPSSAKGSYALSVV